VQAETEGGTGVGSHQNSGIEAIATDQATTEISNLTIKEESTSTPQKKTGTTPAGSPLTTQTTATSSSPAAMATTPKADNNNTTTSTSPSGIPVSLLRSMSEPRVAKFTRLLNEPVVDIEALRELAWSGIPQHLRPLCWRLLLGYLPPNRERREQILARKRREYRELIPEYYDSAAGAVAGAAAAAAAAAAGAKSPGSSLGISNNGVSSSLRATEEESALRQVAVDVPRTAPGVPFFHLPRMQKVLERILYIWGVRHPASGYVQGINDLATPFLAVFASEKMHNIEDMSTWTLDELPESDVLDIEADCYWCLCKLLDGIQDHYTYSQPGIQKTLFHVRELVARVEAPTAAHLEKENVEFMQFAFRWANCLLLRELPFKLGQRLWDTYLAEGPALKEFLVYVLSSFLLSWASQLKTMEFQDLIMFLQRVPTGEWEESDIELVLSRAFMWRASFKGATSHFAS
jgi:TBC1 domain family member 2